MKVLALEVAGVRSHRTVRRMDFAPGLNVIVGPNRAGKTGLADALAAALFGTERAKASPLAKSDLLSWSPGDGPGEDHRTAVEIESRGDRFRIERELDAGRARLLVPEGDGWRTETADAASVASALKRITGLDRADLFLATAYLRQGDLARVADEAVLTRMGELLRGILSGAPEGDVSAILDGLRSAQKDVKADGSKGLRPVNPREYDRLEEERERLRGRIAEAEEASRTVLEVAERKAALEESIPADRARLEEVRWLTERWRRKARWEKEMAGAVADSDSLSRRLRRLGELREEERRVRAALEEFGDADALVEGAGERIPALRAEREGTEKRADDLRAELERVRREAQGLREEAGRWKPFLDQARTIEEGLPLWEATRKLRAEAPPPAEPPAVPSWGRIGWAFILFLAVFAAPLAYRVWTGALPGWLFSFFGLAFPVLVWALWLLNRRLLKDFSPSRSSAPPADSSSGETPGGTADPEEAIRSLLESLGAGSGEEARAGLRMGREARSRLEAAADLENRLGREMEEVEAQRKALGARFRVVLDRFGAGSEEDLLRRQREARDLIRRRDDVAGREKELLAEGTEDELSARLDEADRRRRDLERESAEEGMNLFHPDPSEVERWRLEEAALAARLEEGQAELIRLKARLAEKVGQGVPSPETLKDRLGEIESRIHELDLLHRAYGVAVETLEEAARELEDAYLPRLQESVGEHFRAVVGRDFGIDLTARWPAVTVSLPDHPRVEPKNLSRGTADQLYLALRVACLELLGGDEPLPLILDDPFVHYDDASHGRALEWLSRTAGRTQVVFLAAREAYADWAAGKERRGEARLLRLGTEGRGDGD